VLDALFAAGWPDERVGVESRQKRIHTAVWTLRSLGFDAIIQTAEAGYLLDAKLQIMRASTPVATPPATADGAV
jgi:hypothetical protein